MYLDKGVIDNLPIWAEKMPNGEDQYDPVTQTYIDLANNKNNPASKQEIEFLLNADYEQLRYHAAKYIIYFLVKGQMDQLK